MNITPFSREASRLLWDKWIDGGSVECDASLTADENAVRNKCSAYFRRRSSGEQAKPALKGSLIDGDFCLELYFEILPLSSARNPFTLRLAADDSVWRRLTMCVVPDCVKLRWPLKQRVDTVEGEEDGRSHFWSNPQRNWLKSLWWYAHFADRGGRGATSDFLKRISNHTDPIQHLVERAGRGGYKIEVNREILSRLGSKNGCSVEELKRIMIFNTALLKLVEPQMHAGGVKGYVDELLHKAKQGW
jgi:hypothetical protein